MIATAPAIFHRLMLIWVVHGTWPGSLFLASSADFPTEAQCQEQIATREKTLPSGRYYANCVPIVVTGQVRFIVP